MNSMKSPGKIVCFGFVFVQHVFCLITAAWLKWFAHCFSSTGFFGKSVIKKSTTSLPLSLHLPPLYISPPTQHNKQFQCFVFPPRGLCVSGGFIICLQYFRGPNLPPFDYSQLIKQRRCQAGDRVTERLGGISFCLEARAVFLSSACLATDWTSCRGFCIISA